MEKRLAYAEDVKEQIDEWLEVVGTAYIDKGLSYYCELLGCIEDTSTVEVEPKWIPCSERLPKTNGVYLVTRKIEEDSCVWFITDAVYFDGQNTWHNDNRVNHSRDYLKDVIAWMEKPEPYKIS